jgi:hypothetical protein
MTFPVNSYFVRPDSRYPFIQGVTSHARHGVESAQKKELKPESG